jgi:hypothetical protein
VEERDHVGGLLRAGEAAERLADPERVAVATDHSAVLDILDTGPG